MKKFVYVVWSHFVLSVSIKSISRDLLKVFVDFKTEFQQFQENYLN